MAGKILKAVHKTANNLTYTVNIWDAEAETSPENEMTLKPPFFTLRHEGNRTDPFHKIIPANVTITVQRGKEESDENVTQFYDDLTESPEGRFFIEIIKSPANVTVFRGKILVDAGDFVETKFGDFTITAICGLTDLQNIEYRPDSYSDLTTASAISIPTFKEHFESILRRNQVVNFFKEIAHDSSLSYPLFSTSVNWNESVSEPGDIINQVRVRNIWYEQKTETYRKYRSCYDVLNELLTGFVCRIYYDQGLYHIEQLSYMDNPTPTVYRYEIATDDELISGTTTTKGQINYNTNANMYARAHPLRSRLAPLKAIELEQSKQFFNYMNGMAISIAGIGGNNGPHNFGSIITDNARIIAQWNADINLPTGWSAAVYSNTIKVEHIMTFKVKLGNFYLEASNPIYSGGVTFSPNGQYQVSSGGTIPTLTWTLEDTVLTFRWERTFVSTNVDDFNAQASAWRQSIRNSDLVFESAEIPEDGEMIFEFLNFVTKRNNVTIGGTPSGSLYLRKTSRIIIGSSFNDLYEQPKGIKRWEINDLDNVEVYPLSLSYYDSPGFITNAQLFVTVSGVPYPSTEWTDPDSDITGGIEDLLMKTYLSLRKRPTQLKRARYFFKNNTLMQFNDRIVIDDVLHVILDMEIIANESGFTHYECLLWAVNKDFIGLNIIDTGTPEIDDQPFPLPNGNLDFARSNPNNQIGFEYMEIFTNITNSYIDCGYNLTVLVNLLNTYDIHTKWIFIVNGVESIYREASGSPVIGEWKFDLDNNRFLFGKGSGPVRWIKISKMF